MIHKISTTCLVLLLLCTNLAAQMSVAHEFTTIFNKDGTESSTELAPGSSFFAGCLETDFTQIEKISNAEDGEISLEILDLNTTSEDFELKLVNIANNAEYFAIQYFHNTLILKETYDGEVSETNIGAYQEGDIFRILRCKNSLMYFINDSLIHARPLTNGNDFELRGEVRVEDTVGTDLELHIGFRAL